MPARSDTSLASLLLTQRLVEAPEPPLKASEYWSLLEDVPDPATLLGRPAEEVGDRVAALLGMATPFAFALDEMEQAGLRLVASVDDEYPRRLADRLARGAPPLLYVAGDPALMQGDLLGLVGSRDVAEAGAEIASGAARAAADHGFGIVSGGAKGVDRLAMQAALTAGAPVVGVLADSLQRTIRDPEVRRAITDGQLCVLTPFKPTAVGFSVANAMGRNKLIYALSVATLVVAADADKGGTWAGAVEALRRATAPVLIWTGDGAGTGNAKLVEAGGSAIDTLDDLFPLHEAVDADGGERLSGSGANQLTLDW